MFNYFPAKEDLFYSRLEAFEEDLLTAAPRTRARARASLAAFRSFLMGRQGVFALPPRSTRRATEQLRSMTRLITDSPALLAREREVFERYADALAALIAEEMGAAPGDVEPRAVAGALLGVHRALIDYVRRRALDGAKRVRDRAGRAEAGEASVRAARARACGPLAREAGRTSATTPRRP